MQTQDTRTPAQRIEWAERRVLYLLAEEQPVWSMDDLPARSRAPKTLAAQFRNCSGLDS
jgi:hypothetical protein